MEVYKLTYYSVLDCDDGFDSKHSMNLIDVEYISDDKLNVESYKHGFVTNAQNNDHYGYLSNKEIYTYLIDLEYAGHKYAAYKNLENVVKNYKRIEKLKELNASI